MKKLMGLILAVALVAGAAWTMTPSDVQAFGGRGGFGGGFLKGVLQLDLTDAQKHDIAVVLKKYREEGKAKRADFREAMINLKNVAIADGSNEAAVREAYKAVAVAGEEMAVFKARVGSELRAVLTPEQVQTLEQKRAERLERFKERADSPRHSFIDEWIEMYSK